MKRESVITVATVAIVAIVIPPIRRAVQAILFNTSTPALSPHTDTPEHTTSSTCQPEAANHPSDHRAPPAPHVPSDPVPSTDPHRPSELRPASEYRPPSAPCPTSEPHIPLPASCTLGEIRVHRVQISSSNVVHHPTESGIGQRPDFDGKVGRHGHKQKRRHGQNRTLAQVSALRGNTKEQGQSVDLGQRVGQVQVQGHIQNHGQAQGQAPEVGPRRGGDRSRRREIKDVTCARCGTLGHYSDGCEQPFGSLRRSWPPRLIAVALRMREEAGVSVVWSE